MSHISKDSLDIAKERIDIPTAWRKLDLPGVPGTSCPTPWRKDKKPSFSVFDDGRAFKDHATGESGDVLSFVQLATGWNFKESAEWLCSQAGIIPGSVTHSYRAPIRRAIVKPPVKTLSPINLSALSQGSIEDFKAVAEIRNIHYQAVAAASHMGCLLFGKVCGYACWVITDASHYSAEARRIDGQVFPPIGTLGERKAHTLKGSSKSWPIGLASSSLRAGDGLLLVEGGPDFLAALHFKFINRLNKNVGRLWAPVAMLGRSNSIHPEALAMMKDCSIRLYPHSDPDGGGKAAAERWAQAIHDAGATNIYYFTFEGISMTDGQPVTDLNDCTSCHADSINELNNILPISTSLT